jgi:hypothetical protein
MKIELSSYTHPCPAKNCIGTQKVTKEYRKPSEYRGATGTLKYEWLVCDKCGCPSENALLDSFKPDDLLSDYEIRELAHKLCYAVVLRINSNRKKEFLLPPQLSRDVGFLDSAAFYVNYTNNLLLEPECLIRKN